MWRPKLLGEDILQLLVDFPGGFGLAVDSVDVDFCSFKNSFPQWFLKRKVDADSASVLVCCWFLYTSPPVDSFRVPQILTDWWPVEVILDHWARDMALKMSMFHTLIFKTKWTPLVILVLVRLFRLHDVSFPTFWLFRYVEKKNWDPGGCWWTIEFDPQLWQPSKALRTVPVTPWRSPSGPRTGWKNMEKHVKKTRVNMFFWCFFPCKNWKTSKIHLATQGERPTGTAWWEAGMGGI